MAVMRLTARASVAVAWKKQGAWGENTHRKPREIAVLLSGVDGRRRIESDVCTYTHHLRASGGLP
jgi:hypothetical protein